MHGRFDIKLGAQVRFHVSNHLLSIGGAKQIGFADEHHRTRAGLIKRVHHDQIILAKACARVDQNDAQIASRQIRDGLLRASNRERANPGRIDESDAFCQPIGRQLHENARDVLFVARIFLLARKFRQLGQWNNLRLRFGKLDSSFGNRSVTDARRDRRDRRDADGQHVDLQNIIQQRRLAGADPAKDADFKRCRFHSIQQHAHSPAKFDETMRSDDPLDFTEQPNLMACFA